MSDKILDAYAVVVGLEYYDTPVQANDLVTISENGIVKLDNRQVGAVAKQDKYYDEAEDILDILLSCGTYELTSEDYCFCEKDDIAALFGAPDEDAAGRVIYADNKKALVFLGTGHSSDFFPEDDASYALTELGRQLCKMMEECGNVDFAVEYTEEEEEYTEEIHEPVMIERKEENKMDNVFGKFGFGKCQDNRFSLSINGIAVRQANSGKYVVYNKENNEFVDTTDMLLTIKDALFLLPAVEVNAGDTVIHEGKPYYITDTRNGIKAVSYDECTQTVLIPKSTMFGIKYFIKVFSMFGDNFAATGELFSNPMMLMALMGDNKDSDLSTLMLMSNLGKGDFASNPMLLSFLMKDGKSDLSTLAMMSMFNNGTNPFAPAKKKADKE